MLKYLLLVILLVSINCKNQPTNFDYDSHGANWADQCNNNGNKQSPIDLTKIQSFSKKDSYSFGDYTTTDGIVNFLNTTIYINTTTSFGSIYTKIIDGTSMAFKSNQIRLRMHSEHKIKQNFSQLQVQVFHQQLYQSKNLKLAVGILFSIGQNNNNFIQTIIDAYNNGVNNIKFDLSQFIPKNMIDGYYFYTGSVTTPPCTNGKLNWIVINKQFQITLQQKKQLQTILSLGNQQWAGNYRDTQELNNNQIAYNQGAF